MVWCSAVTSGVAVVNAVFRIDDHANKVAVILILQSVWIAWGGGGDFQLLGITFRFFRCGVGNSLTNDNTHYTFHGILLSFLLLMFFSRHEVVGRSLVQLESS